MPPGARREKIADYLGMCGTISWEERRIRTQDGVELGICVSGDKGSNANTHVVILYFQGNASSLPPRLPLLSTVLGDLERISNPQVKYTVVTLSYRGYWTSRGRASQKGLELDALAALNWIQETYLTPISRPTQRLHSQSNNHKHILVLWGQSIGAGVATGLAAHHAEIQSVKQTSPITALILETPFLSIRNMLVTLYPQRWLPYRYLWPFLRNWWDSEAALKRMGAALKNAKAPIGIGGNRSQKMPVLIVSAANDELVPVQQADRLEEICMEAGFDVQRQRVAGALHTDATIRAEGRNAVVKFLKRIGEASSL
ncbi:hypothetical protein PRK78_007491 [Emydomyces testavorans]|uniref:Alpha/beta superfamily hydrolase n=1 Tax=Emydomyces testavorans TaxID=2070801 RepID=A0AAF0IMQ3_9EURO|nr:hypothetical protein PRK78_007491 [Emydomyces testavorans]